MDILRLVPQEGGKSLSISLDRALVGRDPASDVHLRDASVSRRHAEIRRNGNEWMVTDLESANGVLVDGARTSRGLLLHGQSLQFGNVRFYVEIGPGDPGSTLILGPRPLAGKSTTRSVPPAGEGSPAAPTGGERSGALLIWAFMVGGLAVMAFGVLGAYRYWSSSRIPPPPMPLTVARPTVAIAPTPAAPTPTPATPVTEARLAPAPATGALLISTDARAMVSIDGRRSADIPAGGLQRVRVLPGEHIVSFQMGATRQDQVVRANANEETAVRFSGASPPASMAQSPTPTALASPVLAKLAQPEDRAVPPRPVATVIDTPSAVIVRPTPAPPATPAPADEGLMRGAAADAAGDYYRAVLILKDVAKRLETSQQQRKELARAHAYLAWAYQGLNRPDDARAAADEALKVDPDMVVGLDAFPAQVVSLFKRVR